VSERHGPVEREETDVYVGVAVLVLGLGLLFALFFFKIKIAFSLLGAIAWMAIALRSWLSGVSNVCRVSGGRSRRYGPCP
jgi:dolichol kinase